MKTNRNRSNREVRPTPLQVKTKNPIEQVVGRYVHIQIRGYKGTALCPFHDDHHPSLQVDIKKQSFACYACGKRGDVIDFVMHKENCDFPTALERLGGVPVSAPDVKPEKERLSQVAAIRESHEKFLNQLMPYMSGHPELTPSYLEFGVGVAPMLTKHPMKGRVVFPLWDEDGILKGFSGRSGGSSPKYLNTPSSEGFYRSRFLYGLHRARPAIEKSGILFLVEGCKDVIAMHAADCRTAVGLCGTEMAEGQLELVRKYAGQVYILMDGDAPGRKAAEKIRSLLAGCGVEAEILALPEGEDPDSLFRAWGKERFKQYLVDLLKAPGRMEKLLLTACMLYPDTNLSCGEKAWQVNTLLPTLLQTDDIPFAGKDHAYIQFYLSQGMAWDELPAPEQEVAAGLWEQYHREVENLYREWQEVYGGHPEKARTGMMEYLLYRYGEERLTKMIRTLSRRFRREKNPDKREQLLKEMIRRKSLLSYLSTRLNRPPAVEI